MGEGMGAQIRVQDSGDWEGVPIKRGVNGGRGGGITIKRGSVRWRVEVCGLARSYSSSLGSAAKKIFVLIQPPF